MKIRASRQLFGSLLSVSLAVVGCQTKPENAIAKNLDPNRFDHVLQDGSRLELVSVCEVASGKYWTPQGQPTDASFGNSLDAFAAPKKPERLCLRFTPASGSGADLKGYFPRIETTSRYSIINRVPPEGPTWGCVRPIDNPKGERVLTIPVLAAVQPYKVTVTREFSGSTASHGDCFGEPTLVTSATGAMKVKRFYIPFKLPFKIDETDFSIAAYDAKGAPIEPIGWQLEPNRANFLGDPAHVARVELRTRPIERFAFEDVVVKP